MEKAYKIFLSGIAENLFMLVDSQDYKFLVDKKWYLSSGYAYARIDGERVYAHKIIAARMGFPRGRFSHKNGNSLDNRRCNILRTNNSIALFVSKKIWKNNASKIRGITHINETGKWRARITVQGITYHLGYFENKNEAIKCRKRHEEAYMKSALKQLNQNI